MSGSVRAPTADWFGPLRQTRYPAVSTHVFPRGADSQGTLYYTAIGNPCVFRWVDGLTDPELFPTCLNPSAGAPKDGDAATAVVGGLTAMAADGAGGLWMIDGVARAVRYRAANGVVTTVSSPGDAGAWSGVGGPLADAKLATLAHIAATESGNLALSTTGNLLQAASPADMIPRGFDEGTALRKQGDGTWVRVLRDGTRETYDARGLLVSRGKAGATPVEYVYDAWSTLLDDEVCGLPSPLPKLRRIELAGEPLFQFDWNGDHVTGISDAAGRKTTLTWSGNIMTAISLPGADMPVSFKYDADHRMTEKSSRGPAGSIVKWAYTYENGYIASVAVPGQGEQVFHAMIPEVAIPESSFSPSRVTMQPVSISANKPVAQVPSRTGQSGKLTFSPGRVVVQRAAGDVGSVEVDALGRTSRVTEADGTTLSFTHDDAGRIVELRNENTQDVWTYAYDSATDRMAQRIDPAHGVFRYVYDVDGRLIRRRDPVGGTFTITPNVQTGVSWGLPTSVLDPLGRETLFEYDARGNLAKLTAPGGVVTLVQADVTGRAVRATEPAGVVHSLTWDSYSGETKHVVGDAADGFVTTYQRTLAIGWTDVGSHVPASAIDEATDGMGRTWTWARNEGFQVVHAVTPGDGDVRQTFDDLWRRVTRSTSDGSTEHQELDAAGRLSRRWFSGPAAGWSVELSYDEVGRIAKLVDPKQTETRTFEPGWGWSTMTVQPASGMPAAAQFILKRNRSSAGVCRQTIEPTMFFLHTDFDGIVTLVERETVNQAGSRHDLWKLTPDAARKPSRIDRANGVSSVYHYDLAGRVDKQTESGGNAELSMSWTFDTAGRPVSVTFDGGTRTYAYDAQGRLAACSDTGESYSHDKAGARATAKGQAYTRDARGRLVSDGFHDYGYDELGRRTSRTRKADPSDRTEFVWGAGGLLSQVRRGPAGAASIVASFEYDGSGRRIRKVTANGTWLYGYLPDSDRLARMVDPAGNEWHFVYAARSAAWSAAVSTTGAVRFTHVDPYGRVVALSDETGKVEALHEGCYGQRFAPVSMTGPEIGFHGMVFDTETGLYIAGGRYYDPETGEFLSPDPNGIEGGTDPWGYAGGNPVLQRDPNGRLFFLAVAAAIAGYEIYSEIKQFAQSDDVRRAKAAYQQMTNVDSDDDLAKAEQAHAAFARASDKGGDVAIKSVKKAVETVTSPPDAEGVGDLIKDQIKDKAKDYAKDKAGEAIDHLLNGPAAE
jgi:RHS repeat-associated protein